MVELENICISSTYAHGNVQMVNDDDNGNWFR